MDFADGLVACEIVPAPGRPLPDSVLSVLPLAMRAALAELGPPPSPATLSVRILPEPSFLSRAKTLFRSEPLATQQDDSVSLRPGSDPLKLAFRLGHEFSHWLAYRHFPVRPPLWLDEGLANFVGAAAADACARTLSQTVERPDPGNLSLNLFSLPQLVSLREYPRRPDQVGAFYWQAEKLVSSLRAKLGPAEFRTYLSILCSPSPPPWDAPLRSQWYFNDWDFEWLSRQIMPTPQ